MIIHSPELNLTGDKVCVSCRVELQNPISDLPDRLWFKFPASYMPLITMRTDGFATSLMLLAMYLGEPLEIRGDLSARLAYGMSEWGAIFHSWLPNDLNLVDLKFEKLVESDKTQIKIHRVTGSAFSGGIDSLHTLWCHLPQNQSIPSARVTHGLFLHGFDIRLHHQAKYNELYDRYASELDKLEVTLLMAQTNAFTFTQFRIKWEYAHGGPLIGTALILGNLFNRFYIPSDLIYRELAKEIDGTTALTDHWLSTETTEILHFGSAFPRITKIKQIQDWELAHKILRVCSQPEKIQGINNCGFCYRCLTNIIRLEMMGLLPRFQTFQRPFRNQDVLRLAISDNINSAIDQLLFADAIQARRIDIALLMIPVIIINAFRGLFITTIYRLLSKEKRYRIKKQLFNHQKEKENVSS